MHETSFQANPRNLKFKLPFKNLFPRDPAMVEAIAASIRQDGYHLAEPVVCWDGVVIDGHTRVEAARLAGCGNIYGVNVNFPDEAAAVDYAIARQRNRRNLTAVEIIRCVTELDKRRTKAEALAMGPASKDGAQHCVPSGPSSSATAAAVGISQRMVEQVRTIRDHAPEEVKEALERGEIKTINAAYKATQQARRGGEPKALAIDPAADPYSRYYDELLAVAKEKPKSDWPHIWKAMQAVAMTIKTEYEDVN